MHVYPKDLAELLRTLWSKDRHGPFVCTAGDGTPADPLPAVDILEEIISTCYQVSMMQEEGRSIRFRVMLRDPSLFQPDEGPPAGIHRLIFNEPRPFNEYELRRLAPSADFDSSLIGVSCHPAEGLQIWGLIHSGTRWSQAIRGGSKETPPLPSSLIVYVTGPGRITAGKGSVVIASLSNGRIIRPSSNVFSSRWLNERIAVSHADLMALHAAAGSHTARAWAKISVDFMNNLNQQLIKRVISIIRKSNHGATILTFPAERIAEISGPNPYLSVKYLFSNEESRRRLRTLFVQIMNAFAEKCWNPQDPDCILGWKEYVALRDDTLGNLDEAVFEYANFIANLTAVDGAVVMARGPELIGFGGVILGNLDRVKVIARASDAEAEQAEIEKTEGMGTRHRAAYHLCNEMHDVIALVISQDGNVRMIKWKDSMVTCWDIIPITFAGLDPA